MLFLGVAMKKWRRKTAVSWWRTVAAVVVMVSAVVTAGGAAAHPAGQGRHLRAAVHPQAEPVRVRARGSYYQCEWSDAGHAVNHLYDILYMMGRDDILVGLGGDGGISDDGTIYPNIGGYLPLIDQGMTTVGECRNRQAVPLEGGGRLDVDTNWGIRRSFLPQGNRRYIPLQQPTGQQVMIDTLSAGPTTVILIGSHTNFAIFLMTYPHLKRNVEHIYIMGGGVRSKNPTGCCPENATTSCTLQQCGYIGNLFTSYSTIPMQNSTYLEILLLHIRCFILAFQSLLFLLMQLIQIPVNKEFFYALQQHQSTYEAEYCFKSLKMARDTWSGDQFHASYFMWDSFTSGVAISSMRNDKNCQHGNDLAELVYMNITVITSNEPYGVHDGSNPLFDGRAIPKFGLKKGGGLSGHVQTGITDSFCLAKGSRKGRCEPN